MIKQINPVKLTISEFNERQDTFDEDDDWNEFVQNIEKNGIVETPNVREIDGEYEVITGQRRVAAAQELEWERINVYVRDWTDSEAATKSITENIDTFKKEISAGERARQLHRIAELAKESDNPPEWVDNGGPTQQWFAEELGVTQQTVSLWLEPLRDSWRGTILDPTSKQSDNTNVCKVRSLSNTKLRKIERITGGGEGGVWLAQETAEEELTLGELKSIQNYVNDEFNVKDATAITTGDIEKSDIEIDNESDDVESNSEEPITEKPKAPKTTKSTEGPTDQPETSTAELSSSASTRDWKSAEETTDEDESDNDDDEENIPWEKQFATNEAGEETSVTNAEYEKAKEYSKTADDFAKEIEAAENDEDADSITVKEITLYGPQAEAFIDCLERSTFENPEALTEETIRHYLRDSKYLQS